MDNEKIMNTVLYNILELFNEAKKNEHVKDPVAYALYFTWKNYDEFMKEKKK